MASSPVVFIFIIWGLFLKLLIAAEAVLLHIELDSCKRKHRIEL